MGNQSLTTSIVDFLVVFATDWLLPLMVLGFVFGVAMRALIFYTVKRQDWFCTNFDKRMQNHMEKNRLINHNSFYISMKLLLEKTYYELFVYRSVMKRRNPDIVMDLSDRIFLIQHGTARLVKDALKEIKMWSYKNQETPNFKDSAAAILQNNPCFNRVFGVLPVGVFTDVLNILPGMFIIGGIFGTFLGIMRALPELGGMNDITDIETTKTVMDAFLLKVSFSMSTSIMGIILSVSMSLLNTILDPEKLFVKIVNKFSRSMEIVWKDCDNNHIPSDIAEFDENLDSIEVLAAEAVEKELDTIPKTFLSERFGTKSDKSERIAQEVRQQHSTPTVSAASEPVQDTENPNIASEEGKKAS